MTKRFLLALLGATALIPTAAMAQAEREGRGPRTRERIERVDGEAPSARAEFGGGVRVQAPEPRPDRGNWQRPDRPRADGGNWQRPDRPRPDRGDWQRPDRPRADQPRPDRGDWQRPPQPRPDATPRRDPPRDAQGQIDREQLRREWQAGGFRRDDDRRDRQRREWQRDEWRRQDDRNRGDWGRGDGGWGRSDSDWRDNGRYRGDWNDRRQWSDRGQWNRNWRADRRYDWNRYRDSNRNVYRLPRYYAPQGWGYGYRRFGIGVRLNSFLFGQNYWINDPFAYRLPDAYGPYRWVRYYNDALLVDIRSGQVVDVEYDIFW